MTDTGVPPFEFASAGRIIAGASGKSRAVNALGQRALSSQAEASRHARSSVYGQSGIQIETFSVPGEPSVDTVRRGTLLARRVGVEVVVGLGGGSALDAAKAIAILATHDGDVVDYLEVIGGGKSLSPGGLPMVAIPTTAGTGTEVTRNAVLASPEHGVKVSLRSYFLLRLAIVDPALSRHAPAATARTGCGADPVDRALRFAALGG
jgi:alcohol dehydrogenase class IV